MYLQKTGSREQPGAVTSLPTPALFSKYTRMYSPYNLGIGRPQQGKSCFQRTENRQQLGVSPDFYIWISMNIWSLHHILLKLIYNFFFFFFCDTWKIIITNNCLIRGLQEVCKSSSRGLEPEDLKVLSNPHHSVIPWWSSLLRSTSSSPLHSKSEQKYLMAEGEWKIKVLEQSL